MIESGSGDCRRAVGRVRPGSPSCVVRPKTFAGGLFVVKFVGC